jgi:hypothetical protein
VKCIGNSKWPALGALALGFCCSAPLPAAPPTLTGITPRGAKRGKAVDLVLTGTNLTPKTRLVLPFKATQKLLPDAKPNPAQVRVQLTVDASVPAGVYPVRVTTEDGVSPLLLFSVDAFPNVNEVEDNNTFEKAQKVPFPVIVTGQCAGGDVDYFRFPAKKGQRVVIETEAARLGSGIMPQIRVTDSRQRFIAADDTQKVRGDCRVVFTAAADGDYVVEISDSRYRGGNPPVYRLKIGDYDVIEEVFPLGGRRGEKVTFTLSGGTLAKPVQVQQTLPGVTDGTTVLLDPGAALKPGVLTPRVAVGELPERTYLKTDEKETKALDVTPPLTINGRLATKGQTDRFRFPVKTGQRFRIAVLAEELGSNLDGVLRVTDQAGKQLALVDDVQVPAVGTQVGYLSVDPFTEITVPAGATHLVVELRDQRHRGGINFGYRLTIEPAEPDFVVHQPVSQVNVPRSGWAALTVPVTRRGYTGSIQLEVPKLPVGWKVQGGHVPAGASHGVLALFAPANADLPDGLLPVSIEGKSTGTGQPIVRKAERRQVLNPDPNLSPPVLRLRHLAVAIAPAEPFAVQGPAAVTVVKGYPTSVAVTVTRAAKQTTLAVEVTGVVPAPTALAGLPQPAGQFTFKPASAAAGTAAANFTITPGVLAPEGKSVDLLVQGKAKVNNVDTTVIGPPVALTVLKPFAVVLLTPDLTAKAGQTVTLKGRLQRQAVFKEAVTLNVLKLPSGVTLVAALNPLAGNQNDFQIDLRVDPKAAAGTANLELSCTTTISGMAYSHPPVPVPLKVTAAK